MSAVDELSEADMRALLDAAKPPRFNARHMADEILAKTPAAKGGGDLYIYRDGCFRPKGRLYLQREVAAKLGDKWKSRHSSEVVTLIEHTAQELWDTPDPDLIQLANGILDVTSGDLMPPTPDYLSPARLPIHHDPAAKCPAIDKALSDTLDPELRENFLELAGYLATADNSLQKAIMFLGSGANGKSVLLRLVRAYLGPSNVSNVALHRLDEDRFAAAELYGKHANIFSDLDARALQASGNFKSIVGQDAIVGERKYADSFSFVPFARLLFSANEPPPTPDSSDAFFRRWEIFPFERKFEGRNADRNIVAKLTTQSELSGLLNKGLERLPDLRSRGAFTATTAGGNAAERFRVDSDSVAGFLAECELGSDYRTQQSRLFPAYREWCVEANRKPLGKQRFNRRFGELAPTVSEIKSGGVRYWDGIALGGGAV